MKEETTIYEKDNIKITNARAIFGDKTYSMSNITSVEKGRAAEQGGCLLIGLFIGGLLALVFGIGNQEWGWAFAGLLFGGLGIFMMRSQKPEYLVQFGSASGEIKAYKSTDEAEIKQIVEAINTAIIQKG